MQSPCANHQTTRPDKKNVRLCHTSFVSSCFWKWPCILQSFTMILRFREDGRGRTKGSGISLFWYKFIFNHRLWNISSDLTFLLACTRERNEVDIHRQWERGLTSLVNSWVTFCWAPTANQALCWCCTFEEDETLQNEMVERFRFT